MAGGKNNSRGIKVILSVSLVFIIFVSFSTPSHASVLSDVLKWIDSLTSSSHNTPSNPSIGHSEPTYSSSSTPTTPSASSTNRPYIGHNTPSNPSIGHSEQISNPTHYEEPPLPLPTNNEDIVESTWLWIQNNGPVNIAPSSSQQFQSSFGFISIYNPKLQIDMKGGSSSFNLPLPSYKDDYMIVDCSLEPWNEDKIVCTYIEAHTFKLTSKYHKGVVTLWANDPNDPYNYLGIFNFDSGIGGYVINVNGGYSESGVLYKVTDHFTDKATLEKWLEYMKKYRNIKIKDMVSTD